ncbi:acylglycerol kinase family protein [Candidatus Saccharibacteria bacterium]|nr:acylglycerol kinase family protein [Candidatus Saccharibacteria bacterium]
MQRLIVVYNPNSSRFKDVQAEVLAYVKKIKGLMVGKYEVVKKGFEHNVEQVAKILRDGDLVIAGGGDATAAITMNGIMKSKKDVIFGVLPYGNFNDLARTLKLSRVEDIFKVFLRFTEEDGQLQLQKTQPNVKKLYPLEIYVDGELWRYASCYVTMGMTAEAVEIFDNPKIRKGMQKGRKSSWRSYVQLAQWYFKNRHKKEFIPEFTLNGRATKKGISDYCALSGASMCRVMKGGDDYLKPKVFRSENCRLINFWRLCRLMIKSILVRTPGAETTGDVLEFVKPATVELQAEGEYQVFKEIKKIEVKKAERFIRIVQGA